MGAIGDKDDMTKKRKKKRSRKEDQKQEDTSSAPNDGNASSSGSKAASDVNKKSKLCATLRETPKNYFELHISQQVVRERPVRPLLLMTERRMSTSEKKQVHLLW